MLHQLLLFFSVCLVCQVCHWIYIITFKLKKFLLDRKLVDNRRSVEMWTTTETCDNCVSSFTDILRFVVLRNHDANASGSLLLPCLDIRWLPLPSFSISVLQQRLLLTFIYDLDDNQSLRSHHVSTFIPEDLPNKVHYSSIIPCVVYFISHHGESDKWINWSFPLTKGLNFQFFPLVKLWGELGYASETFSCTILRGADGRSPKKFIFSVGFLLPCFIIIVSYSCIFNTVRKQHAKLNKFDTTPASRSKLKFFRNKNDLRLTIMMLGIFLCFIMCFLPLMVVNVFDTKTKYPFAHVMASVSAWSSAVINPVIYAVGSSQYRNAYKNLFVKIKTWRSSNSSGNNNNNKINVSRSNTADPNSIQTVPKIPGEGLKPNSSCLEVT